MKVHNFNIKNSDDSVTIIRVVLEENVGLLERERFVQKVFKVKDYKDLNEIIYFVKTIYKDFVIEELEINIFDRRGNLNKKVRYEKDELKDYAVYNISVNGKPLNFVLSDGNLHITDIKTNDLNLGDAANNRAISRMISDELTNISLLGSYNITFNYDEKEKTAIMSKLEGQKYTIQRSKGLGENQPEMMWETTMNPETRRLIRVMPEDVEKTKEMFELLLGDNLAGRKEHIAEYGHEYIDLIDVM